MKVAINISGAGPLFTKRPDVLSQDLLKSRSCVIGCYNRRIALKFYRQLDSVATEVSLKFQSEWKSLHPNLTAAGSYGRTSVRFVNRGPESGIFRENLVNTKAVETFAPCGALTRAAYVLAVKSKCV